MAQGISAGRLVRDERFARLLPQCPDPLTEREPGAVRVEASPDEAAGERAQLEFDAMQLLGRTSRWTGLQRDRNRERIESLQSNLEETAGQRDQARKLLKRARRRIEKKNVRIGRYQTRLERNISKRKQVRQELRAERDRFGYRMRRRGRKLRKRAGAMLGR